MEAFDSFCVASSARILESFVWPEPRDPFPHLKNAKLDFGPPDPPVAMFDITACAVCSFGGTLMPSIPSYLFKENEKPAIKADETEDDTEAKEISEENAKARKVSAVQPSYIKPPAPQKACGKSKGKAKRSKAKIRARRRRHFPKTGVRHYSASSILASWPNVVTTFLTTKMYWKYGF